MAEPANDSDPGLLTLAASGDPAAARAFLDQTAATVFGFVYARVGGNQDVAEDLTQATYLEALRSSGTFRGESAIETWLCTIARRQVARHYETERRRFRLERKLKLVIADEADEEEEPDDDSTVDAETMIEAMGRLTPLHRQVLVLKYLDRRSVEDIADELGRSRVQIQSLLQRARASMKRELEALR